eukprot:gene7001-biopygen11803
MPNDDLFALQRDVGARRRRAVTGVRRRAVASALLGPAHDLEEGERRTEAIRLLVVPGARSDVIGNSSPLMPIRTFGSTRAPGMAADAGYGGA